MACYTWPSYIICMSCCTWTSYIICICHVIFHGQIIRLYYAHVFMWSPLGKSPGKYRNITKTATTQSLDTIRLPQLGSDVYTYCTLLHCSGQVWLIYWDYWLCNLKTYFTISNLVDRFILFMCIIMLDINHNVVHFFRSSDLVLPVLIVITHVS